MNIFESNFMRRARYLPEEKKAFLLDTTDYVRRECFRMKPIFDASSAEERNRISDNIALLLEKQSATMWMLLDHPKYQTVQLIEARLAEMEEMITHHRVDGYYTAACFQLTRNKFGSVDMGVNGERIPQGKKAEYENCIKEYINLSDSERERFIADVKHPLDSHQIYRPFPMAYRPVSTIR